MTDPSEPDPAKDFGKNFRDYMDLFHKESDRGAVIVASAILDDLLRKAILARLVSSAENEDELLGGYRNPCSSFGARIDLAYRLGLFSPAVRLDLHLVRKMRNDAAHTGEHRDFKTPQVLNRLLALVRREGSLLDIVRQIVAAAAGKVDPSSAFAAASSSLDAYLTGLGPRNAWDTYAAVLAVSLEAVAAVQKRLSFG